MAMFTVFSPFYHDKHFYNYWLWLIKNLESTIDLSKNDGLALWVILESLFLIKYYLMCCLLNKKRYNLLELRRFVICKMLVKEKY